MVARLVARRVARMVGTRIVTRTLTGPCAVPQDSLKLRTLNDPPLRDCARDIRESAPRRVSARGRMTAGAVRRRGPPAPARAQRGLSTGRHPLGAGLEGRRGDSGPLHRALPPPTGSDCAPVPSGVQPQPLVVCGQVARASAPGSGQMEYFLW